MKWIASCLMLALLSISTLAMTSRLQVADTSETILGDINGDNIVNIVDVCIVAAAFGSTPAPSNWKSYADVNGDGLINILDITVVILHFGEEGGEDNERKVLAGWRSSPSGFQQGAEPGYWVDVAKDLTSKIGNSIPSGVWVLGETSGHQCRLTFPSSRAYPNVTFSRVDENEKYLSVFDAAGLKVWLQVEPADADVDILIDLVLGRYHQYSCVIGFGVDVEWLEAERYSEGRPVTNEEAQRWLEKVKSYDPSYKLFLKHWLTEKMPTAYFDDIVFIDDSQGYSSLYALVNEFKHWGTHFSRSEVCFQIGYSSDEDWWSRLADPYQTISSRLNSEIPNCNGVYWIDFTLQTLYPPG